MSNRYFSSLFDCTNKIFVWGTGFNASVFVNRFKIYKQSNIEDFVKIWNDQIIAFIDNDSRKIGTNYDNKLVVSYADAVDSGMDFCIITVSDCSEIIETLRQDGFTEDQFIQYDEFLQLCRNRAILIRDKECDIIEQSSKCQFHGKLGIYIRFSRVIDNGTTGDFLYDQCGEFSPVDIVGALNWYFGDDIGKATEWCVNFLPETKNIRKTEFKTLGIIIDRYHGGGIERTTSRLLNEFSIQGYKVILITDEMDERKEFSIPDGVFRYNMKNHHDNVCYERLDEFQKITEKFAIDLVMFHTGYARLSTFFEVLLFRLLSIPVIVEVRSAFHAILADQKRISDRFKYIYRLANRVVTLSDMDAVFWRTQGCNSVCIPNPVIKMDVGKWTPKRINEDGYFNVLWVGRIVQKPKQVLDVIPIMKNIVSRDSKVKLRIIGARDSVETYTKLIQQIENNNLTCHIEILEYRKDLHDIYRDTDIVLMTSASESYSNVIMEAKFFSRPIVMYELPWIIPVQDGKGLISVKQRDTEAAANAIISLTDKTKWEKYSKDAWNSAQSFLKYDYMDKWNDVIDQVLNNVDYEYEICDGIKEMTYILLEQLYGRGYPYTNGF